MKRCLAIALLCICVSPAWAVKKEALWQVPQIGTFPPILIPPTTVHMFPGATPQDSNPEVEITITDGKYKGCTITATASMHLAAGRIFYRFKRISCSNPPATAPVDGWAADETRMDGMESTPKVVGQKVSMSNKGGKGWAFFGAPKHAHPAE